MCKSYILWKIFENVVCDTYTFAADILKYNFLEDRDRCYILIYILDIVGVE